MAKKIMIIEDEPDIREYLLAVLEDNGYRGLGLSQERSAAKAATNHSPDLILIDIMMPKRSGISIFMELRRSAELRHIPIAFMSGISNGADFLAEEIGKVADHDTIAPPEGFIEKPIRREGLIGFLDKLFQ